MKLLLDASFFEGVIALVSDEEVIREERIALGPLAEDDLAVLLKDFLKEEVESFALGIGPGSFTGMRVASSLILPLAYARALPLLTFSSLEGIAPAGEAVIADGKRGNFYLLERGKVRFVSLAEVPKTLPLKSPQPLKKMYPALEECLIEQASFKAKHLVLPLHRKWENRELVSPLEVKLHYYS